MWVVRALEYLAPAFFVALSRVCWQCWRPAMRITVSKAFFWRYSLGGIRWAAVKAVSADVLFHAPVINLTASPWIFLRVATAWLLSEPSVLNHTVDPVVKVGKTTAVYLCGVSLEVQSPVEVYAQNLDRFLGLQFLVTEEECPLLNPCFRARGEAVEHLEFRRVEFASMRAAPLLGRMVLPPLSRRRCLPLFCPLR